MMKIHIYNIGNIKFYNDIETKKNSNPLLAIHLKLKDTHYNIDG